MWWIRLGGMFFIGLVAALLEKFLDVSLTNILLFMILGALMTEC